MIWPAWFLRRVAEAVAPLIDDDELAAAAAADLRVLAGLPGHRAPSGAWLEVVPWLPAYQGAVRLVLDARGNADAAGPPPAARRGVRPGADGVVPSAQIAAGGTGAVVSATTLLARIAEDER